MANPAEVSRALAVAVNATILTDARQRHDLRVAVAAARGVIADMSADDVELLRVVVTGVGGEVERVLRPLLKL